MIFRFLCEKLGGHWHCKVSSSPARDQTFAVIGKLVMDERDFEAMKTLGTERDLARVDDREWRCFELESKEPEPDEQWDELREDRV